MNEENREISKSSRLIFCCPFKPINMFKIYLFLILGFLTLQGVWIPLSAQPASFAFSPNNQSCTLIGKVQIDGTPADSTDWIAAFDSSGNCAGASQVIVSGSEAYISLTIYGDDPNTFTIDEGINQGEVFFLSLWDASANQQHVYAATCDPTGFMGWQNNNGAPLPGFDDPNTLYHFKSLIPPTASWPTLPPLCESAPPIQLNGGAPTGGHYSGPGIINELFDPGLTGPGVFSLFYIVVDSSGCLFDTAVVDITVLAAPQVTFAPIQDLCMDTPPFLLSGGSPIGGTYVGPGVSGETFDPQAAGAGLHVLIYSFTDTMGCTDTAQQSIRVEEIPISPTIQITGDTLYTLSPEIHEWYINGTLINGASDSIFIANQSGMYTTKIIGANGCKSALSNEVSIVITDLELIPNSYISIYPNPANENIYISLERMYSSKVLIQLTDLQGRIVLTQFLPTGSQETSSMSLSSLSNGIYSLQLYRDDILIHRMRIYKH